MSEHCPKLCLHGPTAVRLRHLQLLQSMREQLLQPVFLKSAVHAQATAVMRERGLGAVDEKGRDYASDVTTEQQKALSGVAKRDGQQRPNAHLNRRAGRQGRPKEVTDIASSAAQGDSSAEVDASITADHFNSSAQFADSGKVQSQEGTAAAGKSAAGESAGGLLKQTGAKSARGGSALGDSAVGAQRAAQKFKLPSEKVLVTHDSSLPVCPATWTLTRFISQAARSGIAATPMLWHRLKRPPDIIHIIAFRGDGP